MNAGERTAAILRTVPHAPKQGRVVCDADELAGRIGFHIADAENAAREEGIEQGRAEGWAQGLQEAFSACVCHHCGTAVWALKIETGNRPPFPPLPDPVAQALGDALNEIAALRAERRQNREGAERGRAALADCEAERDRLRHAENYLVNLIGDVAEGTATVDDLRRAYNNWLTFGQGGANVAEAQWLARLLSVEAERDEARAAETSVRGQAVKLAADFAYEQNENARLDKALTQQVAENKRLRDERDNSEREAKRNFSAWAEAMRALKEFRAGHNGRALRVLEAK